MCGWLAIWVLVLGTQIQASDIEARRLLEQERHLDFSATAFVDAAGEGREEVVRLYLEAGLDVDAADTHGHGALLLAAGKGHPAVVKLLLGAGADPDLADAEGRTPLMAALAGHHPDLVRLLLAAGARRDTPDAQGLGALHYALATEELWAVPMLLEQGADYAAMPKAGPSVLDLVYQTRDEKLLSTVLQAQGPLLAWNQNAREVLFNAIRRSDKLLLRLLLGKHAGPPCLLEGGQPLLAYMVAAKKREGVRLLLECGADPNLRLRRPVEESFKRLIGDERLKEYLAIETGITPLMLAAAAGDHHMIELLCAFGAQRGAVTGKYKIAALLFAAWRSDVPSMLVLMGRSPRPEEQLSRVEISLGNQTASYYRNGVLCLQTPISSGRPGFETPSGEYVVTDKQRSRFSSFYKVEMPFFMRLSCSEFGMHAGEVPGYPASHGCIRMPMENAIQLYKQLEIGTLVRIGY